MTRSITLDASSTLTRLVAVVVLILAFIATKPITLQNADSLLIVALVVAAIPGAALAYAINRNADLSWPSAAEIARAASVIAACLTTLAILRTVLPVFVGQFEDEILGLAFIALLLIVFAFTDARSGAASSEPRAVQSVADHSIEGASETTAAPGTTAVETPSQPTRLAFTGTLVAMAVVVGYGLLVALLIQRSGVPDSEWARLIGIQSGLEAAAFAALGALIGVSIQGRAVDAAQQEAKDALDEAKVAGLEAGEHAQDADQKAAVLEAAAEKLTALERSVSDSALPSDLRELDLDLNAVGILPLREIRGHSRTSDDAFLAGLRQVRDEVASAAKARPRARR